jgi:hypothetical protein
VSPIGVALSSADAVRPAGTETDPAPSATDEVVPLPAVVHAPPVSAVPNPLATVRPNASDATVEPEAAGVTVTSCVAVAVAPSSSVTVSVIVYVPPAAYAWVAVAPVDVVPSPQFHE